MTTVVTQIKSLKEMTTPEQLQAIIRKEQPCPKCSGKGGYTFTPEGSNRVCWSDCECVILQLWWEKFSSAIGRHDQFANLKTLAPSPKSNLPVVSQEKIIAALRANPGDSYTFFGPAGTSKSTFCAALYREALKKSLHSTWHVSAHTLMEEFHADSMGKESEDGRRAPAPTVTIQKIKSAVSKGQTPRLFIEEIDKVKWSDFKTNHIFRIIDGIYQAKGQLVINTNLTPEQFEAMFSPECGPAISRRVLEMCKVYNLFPKASA